MELLCYGLSLDPLHRRAMNQSPDYGNYQNQMIWQLKAMRHHPMYNDYNIHRLIDVIVEGVDEDHVTSSSIGQSGRKSWPPGYIQADLMKWLDVCVWHLKRVHDLPCTALEGRKNDY